MIAACYRREFENAVRGILKAGRLDTLDIARVLRVMPGMDRVSEADVWNAMASDARECVRKKRRAA